MNKKVSLREFIKENYHLIATIGVVAALTALFTRLENASYLAFLMFMMFILLTWELYLSFPKSEEASVNLTIFEYLVTFLLFALGVYIIDAYKAYLVLSIPVVFMVIYGVIFIKLIQKFRIFEYVRKVSPEGKPYTSIIRGLFLFMIVGIISLLAVISARYAIDMIKNLGLFEHGLFFLIFVQY